MTSLLSSGFCMFVRGTFHLGFFKKPYFFLRIYLWTQRFEWRTFPFFFPSSDWNIWQLLKEPEYDMNNYAGRGCFPPWPNNLLRDQHKSSHYTKAKFNNCFIISWLEISTLAIESHDVSTSPRSFSPASKNQKISINIKNDLKMF